MKRTVLAISVAALTLSYGMIAANVSAEPVAAPQSGHEQTDDTWLDHDLTRAEAQAGAEKLFDRLDTNHDGTLDAGDHTSRLDALFDRLDTNHDGTISREEFRAWHQQFRKDGRGNGPDGKGHAWHHGPGDGRQGGRGGRILAQIIIHRADPNHTGTVTRAAFVAAALQLFDEADTNHDGKLSGEERAVERARLGYRLRQARRTHGHAHHPAGRNATTAPAQ